MAADTGIQHPIGIDETAYRERENYSPDAIRDALWQLTGGEARGVVLDAGSGGGGWTQRLKASGQFERIICADLVASNGNLDGIESYAADLSTDPLPCGAGEVDWVFALEVMEHLANPRHFVAEAFRALRSGGKLAVTTPCNESLTAKLSFLVRGYFPAFCEHDYRVSGHITPITELDLRRMATEAGFSGVEFFYPLRGRMPKLNLEWQSVLPFLRGRTWSDTMVAVITK